MVNMMLVIDSVHLCTFLLRLMLLFFFLDPLFFLPRSLIAMADESKKQLNSEQFVVFAVNTVDKTVKTSSFRWADVPVDVEYQHDLGEPAAFSSPTTDERICWADDRGSKRIGSSNSTGVAGKEDGETLSDPLYISSGSAANVGGFDGGDVQAGSYGVAVSVTGGFAAEVGGGEFSGLSSGIPLTQHASDVKGKAVPPLYTCEGICRNLDGSRCIFDRSKLIIKGWPQKTNGEYVPGKIWRGSYNRLCMDCYIEMFMVDSSLEQRRILYENWMTYCKKSHRLADKYNKRNAKKAGEDGSATQQMLSEQQKARCQRWSQAARNTRRDYPQAGNCEFRGLVVKEVKALLSSVANEARVAHLTEQVEEGECDMAHGKVLETASL